MARLTLPNFFIAGAPKAGTTSLYHHLSQHPDIFMSPVKEPSYFALEIRPENCAPDLRDRMWARANLVQNHLAGGLRENFPQGIVSNWDDYRKLFTGVRDERAVGEASVAYLWSKTAAREIAAVNPAAKILAILRHPAERAFSHHLHYLSDGLVAHSFSEHIAASLRGGQNLGPYHPFLDFGFYAEQIQRFLDRFPREQVRVWLYEDTLFNPGRFLREAYTFLDVDPNFKPETSQRHHVMEIPRALGFSQRLRRNGVWRALRNCTPTAARPFLKKLVYRPRGAMKMGPDDRRFLVQYYRDDVRRLEHLIERDLSAWLQ
jgi:Sulfotransferase family